MPARVSILFLLYRRGDVSPQLHEWTGLAAFGGATALLVLAALWLQKRPSSRGRAVRRDGGHGCNRWLRRAYQGGFALSVAAAALVPLFAEGEAHGRMETASWPALVEGETWRALPADDGMARFSDSYLGAWVRGVLADSGRQILLRQTDSPTLTLHTTEECYRAYGFRCSTLSAWVDSQGHLWSRFRAEHPDGRAYTVRQCFFDITGAGQAAGNSLASWTAGARSWPDAASWYWDAARPGSGVARTLAVAIAEPVKGE